MRGGGGGGIILRKGAEVPPSLNFETQNHSVPLHPKPLESQLSSFGVVGLRAGQHKAAAGSIT